MLRVTARKNRHGQEISIAGKRVAFVHSSAEGTFGWYMVSNAYDIPGYNSWREGQEHKTIQEATAAAKAYVRQHLNVWKRRNR